MFVSLLPTALASSIEPTALEELARRARTSKSSAVVVMHRGKVVLDWHRGRRVRPVHAMSITKSVAAMAIGRLIETGHVTSLDEPMTRWFPEWHDTPKASITLRHVLEHTSGLQNVPDTRVEIYPSEDFVELALQAELESEPGTRFAYNNKASNLLPAVVRRVTNEPIDTWLRGDLFGRLGIDDFDWSRDRAGQVQGMAGLRITAPDLARLGQLMLDRGEFDGEQLLSPEWVGEATTPGSTFHGHGLMWWLDYEHITYTIDDARLDVLEKAGVPEGFIARSGPLAGRSWTTYDSYVAELEQILGPDYLEQLQRQLGPLSLELSTKHPGPVRSFSATGYLGQFLVVYPELDLVGVRLISGRLCYRRAKHGFADFPELLASVVRE